MTVVALAALLGLRALGILAPVPIRVLIGLTVTALAVTWIINYWKRARSLPLGLRVGLQVIGTTSVIYATGWGPVLSVGFVFCAAQAVAIEGSPAVVPATVWSLVCLARRRDGGRVRLGAERPEPGSQPRHRGADGGGTRVRHAHRVGERARPGARRERARARARTASGDCSSTPPMRSSCSTRPARSCSPPRRSSRSRGTRSTSSSAAATRTRSSHPRTSPDCAPTTTAACSSSPGARCAPTCGCTTGTAPCAGARSRRQTGSTIPSSKASSSTCTTSPNGARPKRVSRRRRRAFARSCSTRPTASSSSTSTRAASTSARRTNGSPGIRPRTCSGVRFASTCIPTTSPGSASRGPGCSSIPRRRRRALVRVHRADGRWRWQESSISNRLADPTINGIILNVRDVTDRKGLDDLLAEESRILEMIAWGERLETVLDRVAALTAVYAEARYCLIRLLDGGELRIVAAPDFPPDAFDRVGSIAMGGPLSSARAAKAREEVFYRLLRRRDRHRFDSVGHGRPRHPRDVGAPDQPSEPRRRRRHPHPPLRHRRGRSRPVPRTPRTRGVARRGRDRTGPCPRRPRIPRVPRRADRPPEPCTAERPPHPRVAAVAAGRHRGRGVVPRPRPLQARQRQPRSRSGRPAPHAGRAAHARRAARRGHGRPARGRRVRRRRRGHQGRPRGPRGRRPRRRDPRAAVRGRLGDPLRQREHRRVRRPRRRRGGRAAARSRRRHVPGEATRAPQRRVPDRPGEADRDEPARPRHGPAPRARTRRARRALPADRRHPVPAAGRARSARALEPPRARTRPARRLHPARRGHRPHRAARLARARPRTRATAASSPISRSRSTCRRANYRSPTSSRG